MVSGGPLDAGLAWVLGRICLLIPGPVEWRMLACPWVCLVLGDVGVGCDWRMCGIILL